MRLIRIFLCIFPLLCIPIFFWLLLFWRPAWGAPCCARNSATPFLIVGNDEAQINMAYSYSGVVAKADPDGVPYFKSEGAVEQIQTTRCDAAFLLSDLWQTGVSVPLIQNTVGTTTQNVSAIGIGDVRVSVGYEFLPAWSYSRWKPQGFLFTLLTVPTGRSPFESNHPRRVDITGNGFFSVGVGGLFIKRWTQWDVFVVPEVHYSLPRTFDHQDLKTEATPGWGGSFGVGAGFSPGGGALRFGFRVHPRYDQGVVSSTLELFSISTFGKPIASCDTGFDVSYLISTHDTAMLSYTDQTLLGVAMNTNLSRSLSVSYQHRWTR